MATSIDKLLEKERPVSPTPSNVSLKSDWSKDDPLNFSKGELGPFEREIPVSLTPSNVSTKSDGSKDDPFDFSKGELGPLQQQGPVPRCPTMSCVQSMDGPAPSNVSLKSDWSKDDPLNFSKGELGLLEKERPVSPAPSNVSLKSDWSKDDPLNFSKGELGLLEKERPVSPTPSNVSLKSDWSKDDPLNFSKGELGPFEREIPVSLTPSNVSTKSDGSKDDPFDFSKGELGPLQQQGPVPRCPTMSCVQSMDGPAPSNVSLKSDWSKDDPLNFSKGELGLLEKERPVSPAPSNVSLKSDWSKDDPLNFSKGELGLLEKERPVSPTPNNVSLKSDWSKDDPLNFSKGELGPFEREIPVSLTPSNVSTKSDGSKDDPFDFSKGELGPLQQQGPVPRCPTMSCVQSMDEKDAKHKLKENLKERILKDNINKETDTELYEIKDVKNKEDAEKPVQSYNEIFKTSIKNVRTVLMKGVAGIGKTFQTKRFMVDWANGNSNKDIDLIVSFDFSELNSRRGQDQSMEDLLNDFFKQRVPTYDDYRVAFVLDGLEKCKLDLDLKNKDLTDIKEKASVDVLLTNLIKGKLLPSAHLWIISQPSGVDKIPSQYIQKVTECRETLKRRQQLAAKLRTRFRGEYTQVEDIKHPNQKNTEHIITRNSTGEVNDEEKNGQPVLKSVTKVNAISEIFKDEKDQTIRTVLTIGEADIGKSFHVQKFTRQWAEKKDKCSVFTWLKDSLWGEAKDAEELLFPLSFSKLKLIKEEKVSLVGLLNHFFKETKESVISDYARFKVLFILDGLDASELSLDKGDILTDVREPASVDVLLTNLIKGNLLPTAKLWITTRRSSLKLLSVDSIDRMTEIREKPDVASQQKLKSQLKEQFTLVSEGIDRQKTSALLNEIYTDLYIVEGERGEVNVQHEFRQVQEAKFKPVREETPIKYHDIFKPASGENKSIRTVLTIGVAGIGKTFASMKYMLDWAEGTANKNIYYTFSLPFRELNLRKDREHSFEELIHQFFPVMKTSEINNYDKYEILIVLDGLDECRLDLNFSESMDWIDVRKATSVNVLLTNLIKGNLLPKAQIWITSRPAASNIIPAGKVDRVTEVRGFNDEQKEEYFRKRFSEKDLAEKILSHVKKSRSLYIMCHIPVFCWITSKVLEDFVNRNQEEGMPKTLTDMYIHFLLLQCRQANVKYGGEETSESSETYSCWNTRNKDTVLSLGKLAFEELEKGNLLFTEENLIECGIDIKKTAVFSGLFTQVIQEGCRLYQKSFFCFVHLSIQEFLAAFYVSHRFNNEGENLLTKPASVVADLPAASFYKTAVDKALDSENGDWDLFLRFLLGLSLETNQKLLQELLKKAENNRETNEETIKYIKGKISNEIIDADKKLSLFHCLNELNDHSLVKEVKKCLQSETLAFENFTASQWSALIFVLLMSDENLDVFDLKKYLKSEKVLLGMLPVVKVSKTTLLSWCELSEESCKGLTSLVLTSASSNLTKLDLSHNDLLDSGVEVLANGLKDLHCKLETLKLSGCQVTEKGCSDLASALTSNTASHLKQLDLSYNHPGEKGREMLQAIKDNPTMKLKTLCLDHDGEHRLKPGLKKYGTDLKFDENTISKRLVLSEGNRKVKTVQKVEEKVARTVNDDRFNRSQVFCEEGLKGLCYWEVEWRGTVGIAVSYRDVSRKWDSSGGLGCNEMSWSLLCSRTGYTAMHGKTSKLIQLPPSQKIAVLLDWEGGTLRYYSVTSGKLSLIYTFHAKFTKPLFPGFWFKRGSVTLCEID
ncbi:uncharacterized protein LOC108891710 isoform X50 [Lates calcarifer]|uniref:Uncharacterized protein LOC108891710 isoform X50 n=1 Tax=Lates calcarifer TaxID=8187 RepID=A0AAJ8B644_LATCA|nr:uncharacterized protein LOC108891710 isoform X50 [Lates calcarifer]